MKKKTATSQQQQQQQQQQQEAQPACSHKSSPPTSVEATPSDRTHRRLGGTAPDVRILESRHPAQMSPCDNSQRKTQKKAKKQGKVKTQFTKIHNSQKSER